MSNLKPGLYVAILFIFIACTKKDISPTSIPVALKQPEQLQESAELFGLLVAQATDEQIKKQMDTADTKLIRLHLYLSEATSNRTIDRYLADGYYVQINLNWKTTAYGPVPFPTDTVLVKKQAREFFRYYRSYKKQITFIAVENEWDTPDYHTGNIKDYINELEIITRLAHKHDFKISDAGITSASLQRWMYSQLTGTEKDNWRLNYYVGLDNNYDALVSMVNNYIDGAKKIDFDYSNVHWYNAHKCSDGFGTASKTFMKACKKDTVICNEFGIKTNSDELFNETVNEIKGNAFRALAYSGTDVSSGKAIKLSDDMLKMLR